MSREQYVTEGARLAIGPWPYSRDDPCAIRPAGLGPGSDGSGRRRVVVVAGGRLVGMVSDRDVRPAGSQSPGTVAGRIMTPDPVTGTSETRVEHAARLMFDARFGSLPVADGNALVGIVTYPDLLRAFVQVLETAPQERIAVDFSGGR